VRKTDNLPPSCDVVTKSGNLNFLEPFRPVQACNATALPYLLPWLSWTFSFAYSEATWQVQEMKHLLLSPRDRCMPIQTLLYISFKHILIKRNYFLGYIKIIKKIIQIKINNLSSWCNSPFYFHILKVLTNSEYIINWWCLLLKSTLMISSKFSNVRSLNYTVDYWQILCVLVNAKALLQESKWIHFWHLNNK